MTISAHSFFTASSSGIFSSLLAQTASLGSDAYDVMPRSNVRERKHRQRVPIDDPAVIAAGVTERDETDEEQLLRDVVRYVRKQTLATASIAPALTRNSSRM
jgi:hypothetical protein